MTMSLSMRSVLALSLALATAIPSIASAISAGLMLDEHARIHQVPIGAMEHRAMWAFPGLTWFQDICLKHFRRSDQKMRRPPTELFRAVEPKEAVVDDSAPQMLFKLGCYCRQHGAKICHFAKCAVLSWPALNPVEEMISSF